MHTQDAARLAPLYPRWHDFRRIRVILDPRGLFLNDYLRRLFDADGPVPSDTAYPHMIVVAQDDESHNLV
jgi:hypothetical protein